MEHEGRHSEPQGAAEPATNASHGEPARPSTSDLLPPGHRGSLDRASPRCPLPLPDQVEVFESAHRILTERLNEQDA